MIAVAAMASQYALLRLAIPGAISTAVMTGNLTNSVLALMDLRFAAVARLGDENRQRLRRSLRLLGALSDKFGRKRLLAAAALRLTS